MHNLLLSASRRDLQELFYSSCFLLLLLYNFYFPSICSQTGENQNVEWWAFQLSLLQRLLAGEKVYNERGHAVLYKVLWEPVCQLLWRLFSHNWLQLQGNVGQLVLPCSVAIYITPLRLTQWLVYRICLTRIVIGMTNVLTVPSAAALWWIKHSQPKMICCCALNVMPMIIPPSATTARKPSCQVCLMMKTPTHWESPVITLHRVNVRQHTVDVKHTPLDGFRQSDRSGQSSQVRVGSVAGKFSSQGQKGHSAPFTSRMRQKEEVKPVKPPMNVCSRSSIEPEIIEQREERLHVSCHSFMINMINKLEMLH